MKNGGRWWVVGMLACCAFAQSGPASLGNNGCAGGPAQPRLAAIIPVTLPTGGLVSVPVCIVLGTGVRLDTAANPMRLEVTAPVNTRMVLERFPIDPATAQETGTFNVTLQKTPAPGALLLVWLKSSVLGGDVLDAVPPGAVSPKNLIVTLPLYRPFTVADQIVVVYWTAE